MKQIMIPAVIGALVGVLLGFAACSRKAAVETRLDAATVATASASTAVASAPTDDAPEAGASAVPDAGAATSAADAGSPPAPSASVDDATPAPPELRDPMSAGFVVVGITKTEAEATTIARAFRGEVRARDFGPKGTSRWATITSVLKLFDKPPRRPDWLWAVRVSGLTQPEAARLCLWLLRSGSGWTNAPNRVCAYSKDPWFTNKTPLVDPTSNHEGGL